MSYENPMLRIQRRWLEVFIEEWQRWLNSILADTFNPAVLMQFMKSMGIDMSQLAGMVGQPQTAFDPYQILGLEKTASDEEVKKRYRHLMTKIHPDVAGKGTEFLTAMVNLAYEQIERERGW